MEQEETVREQQDSLLEFKEEVQDEVRELPE